jgi:outer membrane lipoprotein carrier protein
MRQHSFASALLVGSILVGPATSTVSAAPLTPGVLAAPTAPADATLSAQAVADRVQAFYNQTKTFQADFKQEYFIKLHNQRKSSSGRVAFEKPGKMSWKYDQPNGNRVVSDGRLLKVYETENQQMFEQPVTGSQYPAALAFLMGQGDLNKSFSFRLLDPSTMKDVKGAWVLEGTPTDPTPAYQKVLLYVDKPTSQVRRVLILDAQGNRNRFDFDNPTVNLPVPATEFSFTPPEGTQIVRP